MPLDLETEIARRLDASPEAVSDVLANVVERIRQQVSYYGYARVAGLGTFRGDEDRLLFEPDPTLAEHVNLKFVGLDELLVPSGRGHTDADITKPTFGAAGAAAVLDSYEREAEPDEADAETGPGAEDEWEPHAESVEDADLESVSPWADEGDADFDTRESEQPELEHPVYTFREAESIDDSDRGEDFVDDADREQDFADDADRERDFADDATWNEEAVDDAPGIAWSEEGEIDDDEAEFSVLDQRSAEEGEAEHHDDLDRGAYIDDAGDDSPVVQWRPIDLRPESREDDQEELAATGVFEKEDEVTAEDEADRSGVDEVEYEPVIAESDTETDGGARLHESLRGPAAGSRRHAGASERSAGGPRRSVIWLGAGVIVLVAIAAIAFFALRPNESQEPPLAEQTEPQALPDTTASSAVSDTTAAETPPGALPGDEAEQEDEAEDDDSDDDSTPLRSSDGIDPSEGGYTIIVYSESSEQRAADVAARYRGEGFRTDVLEYEDDGATLLRVGIGQFTTLTEAAETRNRLAGNELPDDAWVRRVP